MVIRKINDQELKEASRVFNLSFGLASNDERSNEEQLQQVLNNPRSRFDIYYNERWGVFDEANRMLAVTGAIPFQVRFDGHSVLMSGISGVSTLPEHRGKGLMKQLFDALLNDEYKNNYVFSYLYPFSTRFYQKLGYELCCEVVNYQLKITSLKQSIDKNYTVHLHEMGSHKKDIQYVYNQFMSNYNLSVIREEYDYNRLNTSNPVKDQHYIYVLKNINHEPIGVLSFKKTFQNGKGIMSCDRLYFTNLNGLSAIFDFVQNFKAYYDAIQFILPSNIRLSDFLDEWVLPYSNRQLQYRGMVRVINVERALQCANYKGSGECIIEVTDPIIVENSGKWHVSFIDGRLESLIKTDESAHIVCDINNFSRLIVGTHSIEELPYLTGVTIKRPTQHIEQVFYKKKMMIFDSF